MSRRPIKPTTLDVCQTVIGTTSRFRSHFGSDDGFGTDNAGRRRARSKAKAAGVNPDGKIYIGGLVPKGELDSPDAWVDGPDDLRRRCEAKGFGCEGRVNVEMPEIAPDPVTEYEPAPDIVAREVAHIVREHGGDITPSERVELTHQTREDMKPESGIPA